MKIGYFDTKELASKDGQRSPFGEQQVRSELSFIEPNSDGMGPPDHCQQRLPLT